MPDYETVARWEWHESGLGNRRRSTQVAKKPLHAAEPGAEWTLCGESTEQMIVTGPWPRGLGGHCHECKALAGGATDAEPVRP